jgi:uncharacterized protein (TIGR02145 family)
LVELLIAIAIGAIFMTGTAVIIVSSLGESGQAANVQTASTNAQSLLNNVRVWSEGNWNNILSLATGSTYQYYLITSSSPYTATSGVESIAGATTTYTRYFYVSDVYRNGGSIAPTGAYDPSTKQISVVYGWTNGTTSTMSTYLTRNQNAAFDQADWSGGATSTVATSTNNQFASSSNINYSITGSISVSTAGGSGGGGSSFTCGSPLVDARDSQSYTTVQIGTQCWMQQNLNVGTEILGASNQGTSVSSASSIQKYCYSDASSSCATYGGLYQWTQAVGGSSGCDGTGASQPACTTPIQGVCPASWHIPSHYEWTQLELATCTSGTCATDFPYDETTQGWQGTNEGTTLQSPTGLFRGLLAGYRGTVGSFGSQSSSAGFWSSLASGGSAWGRFLFSGDATVDRYSNVQAFGFSVRCVKN